MFLADALLRSRAPIDPAADLYSFEASAIAAAADLRLESAGQLERIAALAVDLDHPRFIEWPIRAIMSLLARVTPISPRAPAAIWGGASRAGVFLRPDSGGLQMMPLALGADGAIIGGRLTLRLTTGEGPSYSGPDALRAAVFHDPTAAAMVSAMDSLGGAVMDADHVMWMAHRLGRLIPMRAASDADRLALRTWGAMATVGTLAFSAMLALDAPEIRRERRGTGAAPGISETRDSDDRLSVVTLRLSDPALHRAYTGEGRAPPHSGPARHMVRGHMFLARNGKMTWRRPHWRGDPSKRVLRRVI